MLSHDTMNNPPGYTSIELVLKRVMRQVEYHCFADLRNGFTDPLYKELCMIISEVYIMNPDAVIKVNRSKTYIRLVQDIYSQLRNDHVRLVFYNFHDVSYRVYNKKAYLRTALYNAVFEIESNSINAVYGD